MAITIWQLQILCCKFCPLNFRGLTVIARVTHASKAGMCAPFPPYSMTEFSHWQCLPQEMLHRSFAFPLGLRSMKCQHLFFSFQCWHLKKEQQTANNLVNMKKNIFVKLLASLCPFHLSKNPPGLSINLCILVQQSQVYQGNTCVQHVQMFKPVRFHVRQGQWSPSTWFNSKKCIYLFGTSFVQSISVCTIHIPSNTTQCTAYIHQIPTFNYQMIDVIIQSH